MLGLFAGIGNFGACAFHTRVVGRVFQHTVNKIKDSKFLLFGIEFLLLMSSTANNFSDPLFHLFLLVTCVTALALGMIPRLYRIPLC